MAAEPGSFRALAERLLTESFPSLGRGEVDAYVRRAEARLPAADDHPVVLIVDDEEDLRDILRRMLERRGYHTLLAADADEARAVCRDRAVDFVVIDLGTPGGDFPGARVVRLSGLPREIAVRDGLIGVDDVLVTADMLPAALASLTARSRP